MEIGKWRTRLKEITRRRRGRRVARGKRAKTRWLRSFARIDRGLRDDILANPRGDPFLLGQAGGRGSRESGENLAGEFGGGGAYGGAYQEPFCCAGYAAEWGTTVGDVKGIG